MQREGNPALEAFTRHMHGGVRSAEHLPPTGPALIRPASPPPSPPFYSGGQVCGRDPRQLPSLHIYPAVAGQRLCAGNRALRLVGLGTVAEAEQHHTVGGSRHHAVRLVGARLTMCAAGCPGRRLDVMAAGMALLKSPCQQALACNCSVHVPISTLSQTLLLWHATPKSSWLKLPPAEINNEAGR